MCQLHKQKFRCAYPDLQVNERRVVDAAWTALRETGASTGAGFALRTQGGNCITGGATGTAEEIATAELTLLAGAGLRSTGLSHVVAAYGVQTGWPSRGFIEGLMEIDPAVDFLLLDIDDGHSTRWSLKQLLACERTV